MWKVAGSRDGKFRFVSKHSSNLVLGIQRGVVGLDESGGHELT